jgi:hypothetical protein
MSLGDYSKLAVHASFIGFEHDLQINEQGSGLGIV